MIRLIASIILSLAMNMVSGQNIMSRYLSYLNEERVVTLNVDSALVKTAAEFAENTSHRGEKLTYIKNQSGIFYLDDILEKHSFESGGRAVLLFNTAPLDLSDERKLHFLKKFSKNSYFLSKRLFNENFTRIGLATAEMGAVLVLVIVISY